ncbi:MAG TPA: hypothetical protein GXZ37_00815, partial [Clostridiales bacterium]|nr:hypothetical protein [Clostridiales bacterium]
MVKVIKSIFNRIKHKSLTQQLFFIKFGLMLIAAVLVSLPTFIIFRNIVANQIALARVDVLKQIGERTRVVKNSLAFLSNLYYYDEEVVGYINGKEIDYQTNLIINRKLSDRDSKYSTAFNKINFSYYIVLYGENGTRYVSTQSTDYDFDILTSNLWYRDVLENKGNIHWVSSFKDYSDRTNPRYVFSAARIFLGPENQNVAGLLLVNTDERLLYETYKNALSGKNRIYIVDERGNIVSNDDGGMLGLNYYNMDRLEEIFGSKNYAIVDKSGKSVLLSRYKDYESGWMIIEEVLTEDIFGELYRATFMIAMILGLFIIFSATFSYLLAKNITAPLKAICNYMKEVENGDIDVISDIQGWKEIQDISNRFNRMLREIKK